MKQKDILFLLISSAFLAAVWIVFTILHNALTSTISGTTLQQIQPINGTFDTKTLQVLQTRKQITPNTTFQGSEQYTPTPTLPPVQVINPTGTTLTPTVITITATPTLPPVQVINPTATPTP